MPDQSAPMDAALDAVRRAQFGLLDAVRRMQGDALGAFGFNATESEHRVIASGPFWRLRDYGHSRASSPLLVVAAPIKRPYIWDLTPAVSALRYCLQAGLHVRLLEWLPATRDGANSGLDEYADAIAQCVAMTSRDAGGEKPVLIGHSLGGTLAAIYSAWSPADIGGVVLLGAPLCFEADRSRFRDALVALVPPALSSAEPFPGSLLSHASAAASPGTFIWSRLVDAMQCMSDQQARDIHARVERWALDEVALPGKLVHELVEWLYRENRFCRGQLSLKGVRIGPATLSTPVLAVVNTGDEVAPLTSIAPFAEAMTAGRLDIIEFPPEAGVCLQHLGILVGRGARARVWPQIVDWLSSRRAGASSERKQT